MCWQIDILFKVVVKEIVLFWSSGGVLKIVIGGSPLKRGTDPSDLAAGWPSYWAKHSCAWTHLLG